MFPFDGDLNHIKLLDINDALTNTYHNPGHRCIIVWIVADSPFSWCVYLHSILHAVFLPISIRENFAL